jgi:hypothetical protein
VGRGVGVAVGRGVGVAVGWAAGNVGWAVGLVDPPGACVEVAPCVDPGWVPAVDPGWEPGVVVVDVGVLVGVGVTVIMLMPPEPERGCPTCMVSFAWELFPFDLLLAALTLCPARFLKRNAPLAASTTRTIKAITRLFCVVETLLRRIAGN